VDRSPRACAALALAGLLLAALPAEARRGSKSRARKKAMATAQRYVQVGEDQFRLGDFGDAVVSFDRAIEALEAAGLEVPPLLHRSLARAHDHEGQVVTAIDYYRRFLDGTEEDARRLAKARKEAGNAIRRLEGLLDRTALKVEVRPEGAAVEIDGAEAGRTPLALVKVKPGRHRVTLSAVGHVPVTLEVEVAAGATAPVLVVLEPAAQPALPPPPEPPEPEPAPPPPPPDEEPGLPWGGIGLGALAAGLGVGAALLASHAYSLRDDAQQQAWDRRYVPNEQQKVEEQIETAGTVATTALALAAGAVVAAAGTTWLLLGPSGVEVRGSY